MCFPRQLSRVFAVIFTLCIGFQLLHAQDLSYDTVTVNGQSYYKYKVQQGEGLYTISRIFSVTMAEILRHNPDANKGLKLGQELLIPVSATSQSTESPPRQVQTSVPGSIQLKPTGQNITFNHTVSLGETVYSISKMYNTTVEEVYRLNPTARDGIIEGQLLVIPQRRIISEEKEENYRYHTILPKETLYSVSRTYSLKPEDVVRANPGLSVETFQIGRVIRIPFFESYETVVPYEGENSRDEQLANRLLSQGASSERLDMINVALLLPLLDETGNGHLRLQEYYEGFLLAVKELKVRGGNVQLYVFEIGKGTDTKKLESLLETMEMQSLHLIVGGVSDAQIKKLSDFSRSRNITYVVPFSQSNGEVLNNGNIFQVNSLSQAIQSKTAKVFLDTFRNANLVFVNGGDNDKMEFVSQVQNRLRENGIRYETVHNSSALTSTMLALLSANKENVIIPTSGDSSMLRDLLDKVKEVQEANPSLTLRLLGYPEWQTYSSLVDEYHQIGVYFLSPFFVDTKDPAVGTFNDAFSRWYGRAPLNTYPDYAMWGYDTALFFLTALQRFGSDFEYRVDQVNVNALQFAFHFERMNNWGGFINTGLYLVFYDTNGRVIKMDKSR
ncbi:MAG: LysM peptidoglycan-binding domain-containing protein [Bacteroidota bacterium]|jgi:LysM repeat protein/ABC-type branched-subunit amino acid transport system substrate-binding protein|nr:LysM peptidoglycan-binding domain-containing protein [Bacteroidota bacterium]